MDEIFLFINNHRYFAVVMLFLDVFLIKMLIQKISIYINKHMNEAMGGRNERESLYKKCKTFVRQSIEQYERRGRQHGFYTRAREKMKKSGYRSEYAAVIYLLVKYAGSAALFITTFIVNFPGVAGASAAAVLVFLVVEAVVVGAKKKLSLKFQRYMYKIYKYLHNQISSGVKVTDAIKTVYEVIEDRELRGILVQLAARYELTLDIDVSLDEFRSNFDLQEAETLCVALKQGIVTGDNQELLARQEDVMFKKYFNYIQAETDGCKTRSAIAAALFTAVIVIMIMVPLFNDITEAVNKIFIN